MAGRIRCKQTQSEGYYWKSVCDLSHSFASKQDMTNKERLLALSAPLPPPTHTGYHSAQIRCWYIFHANPVSASHLDDLFHEMNSPFIQNVRVLTVMLFYRHSFLQ